MPFTTLANFQASLDAISSTDPLKLQKCIAVLSTQMEPISDPVTRTARMTIYLAAVKRIFNVNF